METINPSELPHSLSVLSSFPHSLASRKLWLILICHLFICIILSVFLSFAFYQKFYTNRKNSWKRAVEIIGPIGVRLQNLERERIIWKSYLEWIEDYCTVYYGLLNYLNVTATDLSKLCNEHINVLKNINDFSNRTTDSDIHSTSAVDSLCEERVTSEASWDEMTSDEDIQLITNFANVFANLKLQEIHKSECECHTTESISTVSLRLGPADIAYEESGPDDPDLLTQISDRDKFSKFGDYDIILPRRRDIQNEIVLLLLENPMNFDVNNVKGLQDHPKYSWILQEYLNSFEM